MASTSAAHEEVQAIAKLTSAEIMAAQASNRKLIAEDGWIFSEMPGKGIELIRRYDEAEESMAGYHCPSRY